MHSEAVCKALTKCRNCGGPHRSDSRNFQVRPRKYGPVTKKQLAWIRHLEQGKFTKVARARAAAKKAEEAIVTAAKDVSTAEGSGFGVLESEEVWGYSNPRWSLGQLQHHRAGYWLNSGYLQTHFFNLAEIRKSHLEDVTGNGTGERRGIRTRTEILLN